MERLARLLLAMLSPACSGVDIDIMREPISWGVKENENSYAFAIFFEVDALCRKELAPSWRSTGNRDILISSYSL